MLRKFSHGNIRFDTRFVFLEKAMRHKKERKTKKGTGLVKLRLCAISHATER